MTWNYRIMRIRSDCDHPYLALREVHYENDVPVMFSAGNATFSSEDSQDKTEILSSLSLAISSAIQHPILDEEEFAKPLTERTQCPRSRVL